MIEKKIILGGAQFGMKYGMTNTRKNSTQNLLNIIKKSLDFGLTQFDSAPIYGNSEEILGKFSSLYPQKKLKVNTKFKLNE